MRADDSVGRALQYLNGMVGEEEGMDGLLMLDTVDDMDLPLQLLTHLEAPSSSPPPFPPPPPAVRELQWIPIVTSVSSFAVFVVITYAAKQLLKDERIAQRGDSLIRGLHSCFTERTKETEKVAPCAEGSEEESSEPFWMTALRFAYCTTGVLVAFVAYGVLQERVITKAYGHNHHLFNDTTFLVFCGRALALLLSLMLLAIRRFFFPQTQVSSQQRPPDKL